MQAAYAMVAPALFGAALLVAPAGAAAEGHDRAFELKVRRVGREKCPTQADPKRRCLKFRVQVTLSGEPADDGVEIVADEQLVERVHEAFGPTAAPVCDALVPALGDALRRGRHREAALIALDALDAAEMARYYQMQEGVSLAAPIEARLANIARRYFRDTGRTLLVTSGTRDPARQAAAMYKKLILGVNLLRLYAKRDAVRDIRDAYRKGYAEGLGAEEIIARMADVIREQVARGVHISRHLVAGAVDIRSRGLSRKERHALRRAVRAEPGVSVLYERRPPHFHLSFE